MTTTSRAVCLNRISMIPMTSETMNEAERKREARAERRSHLARQVEIACGRRVLLDFLAWLPPGETDVALAVLAFWKIRTGDEL